MNRIPFDLTIDTRRSLDARRAHLSRALKRLIAWLCVANALTLVSIALGMLVAADSDILLALLAGLILLAGLQGARHLLAHR